MRALVHVASVAEQGARVIEVSNLNRVSFFLGKDESYVTNYKRYGTAGPA